MPRRRLIPPRFGEAQESTTEGFGEAPGAADALHEAARLVREQLGGVELAPELVPEHWKEPVEGFKAWVEGTGGKRPGWSPSEAGRLARSVLSMRKHQERLRAAIAARGGTFSMPMEHRVAVCPVCFNLQVTTSRASRRTDECQVCPLECPKRDRHRSNQINCPECRREVQVLWTSEQEIPADWSD